MFIKLTSLILLLSLSFLLFFPLPAQALFNPLSSPFGGRILFSMPCSCSANQLVIVGPPNGGTFVMFPTVKLYENHRPTIGNNVLGMAAGRAPCLVYAGLICIPVTYAKIIYMIGTSKTP